MTTPEPMARTQIHALCLDSVSAGARGDIEKCLGVLEAFGDAPRWEVAAAFADLIQEGCAAAGAVTGDGRADLGPFLPSERLGQARLPATTPVEARRRARGLHRAMSRSAQELLTAYLAGDIEQARQIYQRAADSGHARNLVIMLWGIGVQVWKAALTGAPAPPRRPPAPSPGTATGVQGGLRASWGRHR